jgi:rRNA maturation endonuclease Nob1
MCGKLNDADEDFCANCGWKLDVEKKLGVDQSSQASRVCSVCGKVYDAGNTGSYCDDCGGKLV